MTLSSSIGAYTLLWKVLIRFCVSDLSLPSLLIIAAPVVERSCSISASSTFPYRSELRKLVSSEVSEVRNSGASFFYLVCFASSSLLSFSVLYCFDAMSIAPSLISVKFLYYFARFCIICIIFLFF